jgi:hypothetical protein
MSGKPGGRVSDARDRQANLDIEYISRPSLWKHGVVPITRDTGAEREYAYIVEGPGPGGGIAIFRGNMFMMHPNDPIQRFPSVQALVDAGWRVD